jgi:hypothetical protein
MTWLEFWVLITLVAWLGLLISNSLKKNDTPRSEQIGAAIGFLLLLGLCFGVLVLFLSQIVAPILEGIGNWWDSQPSSSGSTNGDNKVPPYFFFIPFFILLGFLIRGKER